MLSFCFAVAFRSLRGDGEDDAGNRGKARQRSPAISGPPPLSKAETLRSETKARRGTATDGTSKREGVSLLVVPRAKSEHDGSARSEGVIRFCGIRNSDPPPSATLSCGEVLLVIECLTAPGSEVFGHFKQSRCRCGEGPTRKSHQNLSNEVDMTWCCGPENGDSKQKPIIQNQKRFLNFSILQEMKIIFTHK